MKKKKNIESALTPDGYLAFIQKVALQGVGLDSASATLDRVALVAAVTSDDAGEITLDAQFEVALHTDESLVIGAKFRVGQATKKDVNKKLLAIECSFSALFTLGAPTDAEGVTRFANTEARLIFWPYLRHFISDTSYRMAINPILIPLMTTVGPGKSKI